MQPRALTWARSMSCSPEPGAQTGCWRQTLQQKPQRQHQEWAYSSALIEAHTVQLPHASHPRHPPRRPPHPSLRQLHPPASTRAIMSMPRRLARSRGSRQRCSGLRCQQRRMISGTQPPPPAPPSCRCSAAAAAAATSAAAAATGSAAAMGAAGPTSPCTPPAAPARGCGGWSSGRWITCGWASTRKRPHSICKVE